jgi:hypothetical protein
MSMGRSFLFPNPAEYEPTPAQMTGRTPYNAMSAAAQPHMNIYAAAPRWYVGTYPSFENDEYVSIWQSPCD